MPHEEVENLRQAMLTVIVNLSGHDLRNMAILEDCYSCPECMKEVCPTRDTSWDEDGELSCELAWIKTAEKLMTGAERPEELVKLRKRLNNGNGSTD